MVTPLIALLTSECQLHFDMLLPYTRVLLVALVVHGMSATDALLLRALPLTTV